MGASEEGPDGVKGEKGAAADGDAKHINLKVVNSSNDITHFKIKKNTALKKLMNAYCERANLNRGATRFLHEGTRINDDNTPMSLNMEEGDTLEVFTEQLGGGRLRKACEV